MSDIGAAGVSTEGVPYTLLLDQSWGAGRGTGSRDEHGTATARVLGVLQGLERRGAGVPAVPSADQGQYRGRCWLRQAQRPGLTFSSFAAVRTWGAGWSRRMAEQLSFHAKPNLVVIDS